MDSQNGMAIQHNHNMKKLLILCLLVISLFTVESCFEAKAGSVQMINPDEAAALLDAEDAILVDVRSQEAYQAGHIANAINIPVESENLEALIANLDQDKPVMVYCNKGGQSAECARILEEKGFTKIYDLDGGLSSWEASGRKIVLRTE